MVAGPVVAAGTAVATVATGGAAGAAVAGTSSIWGPLIPGCIVAGPPCWILLGADTEKRSWDCWKAVVHDESVEPSGGRPLREVMLDKRIKKVEMVEKEGRQQILLQNQWNENFQVDFVIVDGQLAAHATMC